MSAELDHAYSVVGEMLEYFDGHKLATWAPLASIIMRERNAAVGDLRTPSPFCDWHEDRGDVLWWRIPVCEPPFVGNPLDSAWDGATCGDERNLWWTPLPDGKSIEDQVPL